MYGVEGERDLTEHSLEHLRGFRDSRPVRIGNDAWCQKQLDVLGEVVDAAHLLRDQLGDEFDDVIARLVSSFADKAAASWQEPDTGMWEARDKARPYLSSKVMCWVALDRAIELAPRLGEHADAKSWKTARQEVREAILERGWSEEAGAYTGAFGSDQLDASVLLMPLVDFLPATDPRMWATIEKIECELAKDGLVHRWVGDENGVIPDLEVGAELENTGEGWRSWSELHRGYEGPYVEQVRRSALVLQALTYQPSGAVTAAATTSLP